MRGSRSTWTSTTSASSGRSCAPPRPSTTSARCSAKLRSTNSAAVIRTGPGERSPGHSRSGISAGA
ncbi:hypothetical protein [Nannocystis pusilla]|uniref:hypothetical protein n=1 Tax=Nannocystis pusilla TaxID=889268 RepID=UPI003B7A4617